MKFPLQSLIHLLWPRCATGGNGGADDSNRHHDSDHHAGVVKDLRGDQVITFGEDATADSLKQDIAAVTPNLSVDDIHLLYGGVELTGDGLLSASIPPNSTITILTQRGEVTKCPEVHHDLSTSITSAEFEGEPNHPDVVRDDDSFSSRDIDENHAASNNQNQVVYICWLEVKELVEAIRSVELAHYGDTTFSTLLQRITKIGRCSSWASFESKLKKLRLWINFSPIRYIALLYPRNSRNAEAALHAAYASVRGNGEWFSLTNYDRATIASVFHRVRDAVGGNVEYDCTPLHLGCNFTPMAADTHRNGDMYCAWYNWSVRERDTINLLLNDPTTPPNIRELSNRMVSYKVGCVYMQSVQSRLSEMLWAAGFVSSASYTSYPTNAPFYHEREAHIMLNNMQLWSGYSEWFYVPWSVNPLFRTQIDTRRRTLRHLRTELDWDYFRFLTQTGFITSTTFYRLLSTGRLQDSDD